MAITVNLRYTGKDGAARSFAEEMTSSGTVAAIRAEVGNLRYEYYQPLDDPETILLIDSWTDQEAIDVHHASPVMATIASLREKYDLHMTVERYYVFIRRAMIVSKCVFCSSARRSMHSSARRNSVAKKTSCLVCGDNSSKESLLDRMRSIVYCIVFKCSEQVKGI